MIDGSRTVPGIVVIIEIILIMNYGGIAMIPITITTSVIIIIIMTINAHRHYRNCCKIGWIISIIIWWDIGHISR